jgi:hypothetical protein
VTDLFAPGGQNVPPLAPPSLYRQKQATEALTQSEDMLTNQYIADTILAYLQSPSFFTLWFGTIILILGYRLVRSKL